MNTIETARLTLRPFTPADLDRVAELMSDAGFMSFSAAGPADRDEAARFLERMLERHVRNEPSQFAVVRRDEQSLIGYCGFFPQTVDGLEEIEIAYRLHPEHWGYGFATEAARAVREHAFATLRLPRVISLIHPENHRSRRVAEKNEMVLEKETVFRGFQVQVFAATRLGDAGG
jgi:ribosomal-protein-alanine N-acetyltransferase